MSRNQKFEVRHNLAFDRAKIRPYEPRKERTLPFDQKPANHFMPMKGYRTIKNVRGRRVPRIENRIDRSYTGEHFFTSSTTGITYSNYIQ